MRSLKKHGTSTRPRLRAAVWPAAWIHNIPVRLSRDGSNFKTDKHRVKLANTSARTSLKGVKGGLDSLTPWPKIPNVLLQALINPGKQRWPLGIWKRWKRNPKLRPSPLTVGGQHSHSSEQSDVRRCVPSTMSSCKWAHRIFISSMRSIWQAPKKAFAKFKS